MSILLYFSVFKIYNSLYTIEKGFVLETYIGNTMDNHAPYIKYIRVLCVQGTQRTFVNRVYVIYVSSAKKTM